jgi:tRNA 2-thiouridine synthesizing protein A
VLVVACTDPLAGIDIPNLLQRTGDALEETQREARVITFRIRKS